MKDFSKIPSMHNERWKSLLAMTVLSACYAAVGGIAYGAELQGEEQQKQIQSQSADDTPIIAPADAPLSESVAEPSPDSDTSIAFTLEERLDDAHIRFLSYFADELYPQALVAATQTAQLTGEYYGDQSLEHALALVNVATAQTKTGDLAGAIANYRTSIELIEDREGIVSPRLVNPLMGLAATHNELGAFDRGLIIYKRALRINHVELGLNNDEQMRIRDGLTESYLGLGDKEDANFQQEAQVRIIRQEHGDNLDELLPAIYKLAAWYKRSNQPEQEAMLLQNATRAIKKKVGNDSNEQIRMLRSLAAAHQRLDMPSEAMRLLKKAWRINEDRDNRDLLLSADIEVEIGDSYNVYNDLREARRYYTRAWQTLASEGGNDKQKLLEQYFGTPVNIWSVRLPDVYPTNSKTASRALENPDAFLEGLLVAEYEIDEDGRIDNIRFIESDPAGLLDKRVIYLLGRYFYRPRFADGAPVLTEGIELRHRFRYLPEKSKQDAEKSRADPGDRLEYPGAMN